VRQSPVSKDVNTEAEEATAFISCYQMTTGEDRAGLENFVRALVNCRVCELALVLLLSVVTFCKSSINPVSNPNTVYSHTHTRDNMVRPHLAIAVLVL
jgi:hypothetical protein